MSQEEMLADLAQIVPLVIEEKSIAFPHAPRGPWSVTRESLFGCKPPHSNLFFTIVRGHDMPIPRWFYDKYIDPEETEIWLPYIDKIEKYFWT
jgi:hypothetical protein